MSIQNMLTAALFKRDEAGRILVYPNGGMGSGYILPDPAAEPRMRRTLMWLVIGSGLFGGIGMQIMIMIYGQVFTWTAQPWLITAGALVAFALAYRVVARRLTRGMTRTDQSMGMIEALKRQAEAMPRWYLWTIAVFAPLMVLGSVLWMVSNASVMNCLLGLVGVLLFGVVSLQAIHGLRRRPQE